jgi:hypothetical protein
MASGPNRLSSERAKRVEMRLRARAAQLKPPGRGRSPAAPLGACHVCARTVLGRDGVAMAGVLFHADCVPGTFRAGAA